MTKKCINLQNFLFCFFYAVMLYALSGQYLIYLNFKLFLRSFDGSDMLPIDVQLGESFLIDE